VTVTAEVEGDMFRGFLLQARNSSNMRAGSFVAVPPSAQILQCGYIGVRNICVVCVRCEFGVYEWCVSGVCWGVRVVRELHGLRVIRGQCLTHIFECGMREVHE
jgi:hypothetical protein